MKITGNRGHVEFDNDGIIAVADGELTMDKFYVDCNTYRWKESGKALSEDEKKSIIDIAKKEDSRNFLIFE